MEIIEARNFVKEKTEKKAPPLYVGVALGEQTFKSVPLKTYDCICVLICSLYVHHHQPFIIAVGIRNGECVSP